METCKTSNTVRLSPPVEELLRPALQRSRGSLHARAPAVSPSGLRTAFGAALVLFFAWLVLLRLALFGASPAFVGSETYSYIANQVRQLGEFKTTYRSPLYPLLLAGLMETADELSLPGEVLGLFANMGFAALSGALLLMLVFRLTGSGRAVLCAGVLFPAHLLLQLEFMAKRETALYVLLELLFCLIWLKPERGLLRPAALGVCAGLLHLTRPTGIAVFGAFIVYETAALLTRPTWKKFGAIVLCSGCFLLTLVPWIMATYRITGKLTIASSHNLGQGVYKGHNRYFNVYFPWVDTDAFEPHMMQMMGGGTIHETLLDHRADDFFQSVGWQYIREHPLSVIGSTLRKAGAFISPFPTPFGRGVLTWQNGELKLEQYRPRNIPFGLLVAVYMTFVYCAAVYGVRTGSSALRRFSVFLLLLVLLSLGQQCIAFAETRYRLPLDVLLLALAAAGAAAAVGYKQRADKMAIAVDRNGGAR